MGHTSILCPEYRLLVKASTAGALAPRSGELFTAGRCERLCDLPSPLEESWCIGFCM